MFDSSEVQIPILSMSDNLLKIELTINYKCLLTVSYSVRTGIKHSLGASVFTGYAGREKAPREALTAALSRGAGRPVAGAPVRAACSVERPRAPGSGVRGASGDLARTLHPAPCPRGRPERSRQEEGRGRPALRQQEQQSAQPPSPVPK